MTGLKKLSKHKIIENYIEAVKLYEKPEPINYDLRAYAAYVSEHKQKASEITPEIMVKFILSA